MLKVSAIVMASGFSSRMGKNKLYLPFNNKTFLQHLLDVIEEVPFYERIVVISPNNRRKQNFSDTVKIVLNEQAERGQSQSVRLGTAVANGEGYLYLPVDQPLLTSHLLTSFLSYYAKDKIVFPVNDAGCSSSPVFFGSKFRKELLQITGRNGGKSVKHNHPEACRKIHVSMSESLMDVDTIEDYRQLITYLQMNNGESK